MTEKEKDLLIKDLCARLSYGVKVNNEIQGDFVIYGICENYIFARTPTSHVDFSIEKIKPYLFPLSSMTEEQEKECQQIKHSYYYDDDSFVLFDWYNKNRFDYRGLIEKGLAIDATNLNIYD